MMRHLFLGLLVAIAAAGIMACGDSASQPTQPTATAVTQTSPAAAATVDGFLGVWSPDDGTPLSFDGPENTADSIDPNGACRLMEFKIERDTDAKTAKIMFAATCANARIRGAGTGLMNEGVLFWKAQGVVALASGQKCAFKFLEGNRAERVPEGIKVHYNGKVCDVPVSGTTLVKKKP
jgi:hypothetical protein